MIDVVTAIISLIVLSLLLVMCSEAFKRSNQNWPMIIACSFAMPAFMIFMSGIIGSIM